MRDAIKNKQEALTKALILALTASTDEQCQRAVELAESIASNMCELDVERCKKHSLEQVNENA